MEATPLEVRPLLSTPGWKVYSGRRVVLHAQTDCCSRSHLREELRQAERALAALERLVGGAGSGTHAERIHVYYISSGSPLGEVTPSIVTHHFHCPQFYSGAVPQLAADRLPAPIQSSQGQMPLEIDLAVVNLGGKENE